MRPRPQPRSSAVSGSAWRAAAVTFLVALLVGVGATSAAALWSQNASLATTLSTGTWTDYTRPGWKLPLTVQASQTAYNEWTRVHTISLNWAPDAADAQPPASVTYVVKADLVNGSATANVSMDPAGNAATIVVSRSFIRTATFQLSITPVVNGISGEPTTKTMRATLLGGIEFT